MLSPARAASLCSQDVLFLPETYSISSKHHNLIAFNMELSLLLRVLRAAGAHGAELLEVKLTQKSVPGAAGGGMPGDSQRPYLTFTGRVRYFTLTLGDARSDSWDAASRKQRIQAEE